MIALWDLDNCLADDEWRIPKIDWSATKPELRYAAYHADAIRDRPGNLAAFRAVSAAARPAFCTARPEAVRMRTARWIRDALGERAPELHMRARHDHRSAVAIKAGFVDRIRRATNEKIAFAFDDREDVVEMYRARGIPAVILKIHNTTADAPPTFKGAFHDSV